MKGRIWSAMTAAAALCSLTACASGEPENPPAWFAERAQSENANTYPQLSDVPREHRATTDQRHWDQVEADLLEAARAMKAHPRNEVAPPSDAAAFEDEAREEIEQTAATH